MSSGKLIRVVVVLFLALAVSLRAAEQDHTWSLSGTLVAGADSSIISIGVVNAVVESAFTIEVHYDTTLLEVVQNSGKGIGRATGWTVTTNVTADYIRFVLIDLSGNSIAAGSGDIIQFAFRLKSGATAGTSTTLSLTKKTPATGSPVVLVQPKTFTVTAPTFDEADFTWSLSGALTAASSANTITVSVDNDVAFSAATVELHYDPAILELVSNSSAGTGRAQGWTVTTATGADYIRMVFIDLSGGEVAIGSGAVLKVDFKVKSTLTASTATTLSLTKKNGDVVLVSQQFNVTAGNIAPVWPVRNDTLQLNEGEVYTHTFQAPTDPNTGDIVTISHGTLPTGAAFNDLSLTLSWTPGFDAAGTYNLVLTAADQAGAKNYRYSTLKVLNVNRSPELTVEEESYDLIEGEALSFSVKASDPDKDKLTLTASGVPTGATFLDPVFNWTSVEAGSYTVTFTVADPSGLQVSKTVSITVTAENHPPEFGALADASVDAGTAVNLTVSATDPDNDALVYSLVLADPQNSILTRGATFSGTSFSWTPSASDIGPNLVTFKAEDPEGLSDMLDVKITVTGRNITAPPEFADFGLQEIEEGDAFSLELPMVGARTANLTFWGTNLPDSSALDAAAGRFTWTPSLSQSGEYKITFGVSDGNFQDVKILTLTVDEKDVPPEVDPIGTLTAEEGKKLVRQLKAKDASGEQVVFSAVGLPAGAELFPKGLFKFKPDYDQAGVYPLTIKVVDASGNEVVQSVNLTVVDVNRKPVLDVSNQAVTENESLIFTVSAEDPDGDAVTLGTGSLPTGAVFTAASGEFTWTPDQSQDGNYTILFTASDGKSVGTDSARAIISVGDVNRPPEVDPVGDQLVREGETLTISFAAADPDESDQLQITAAGLPSGYRLTKSGTNPVTATIALTPGYKQQGTYQVEVTATDNDPAAPLSSSSLFTLEVQDVDVAPSFTGSLSGSGALALSVDENGRLEVNLTAEDAGGDTVTYSASYLPKNSRIVPKSGNKTDQWIFTPSYIQSGRYRFDILASDGGQTVSRNVEVTVADVNQPPRLPGLSDQAVTAGDIITFAVNATDLDGDAFTVKTAGRVSFLNEGNPPPARIRDGNVFVFDTALLDASQQIASAVFLFWAEDVRGGVSDTAQIEIAVVRKDKKNVSNIGSGLLAAASTLNTTGIGLNLGLNNNTGSTLTGDIDYSEKSGFSDEAPAAPVLLAGASASKAKGPRVYSFSYLAGDLTSQFYGIRRGWGLDLTAFSAGTGADSLIPGLGATVTMSYYDADLPTGIPNFTEARVSVFGYDGVAGKWMLMDSVAVDTVKNEATFKLTNPQITDYTIGAVVDVVAPLITDVKFKGGSFTVTSTDVDTLYSLDGSYEIRVNITDDNIVSSTDALLYYAVGAESFQSVPLTLSGVNLFIATLQEGALQSGTVIRYYIVAQDEMNTVYSPAGGADQPYQMVLLTYTGKPGDVDGNITINIFDLLELLKVLGGSKPANIQSDVDANGKTDIFDLLKLLKLLAG